MLTKQFDTSTCFQSIGYEPAVPEEGTPAVLALEFAHGGIYLYSDVPELAVIALLLSDSLGQGYHRLIKGRYPCAQAQSVEG